MVVTRVDDLAACTHVIVQANQSMSWRANLLLLACLAAVTMGIAAAFAALGLWLVLPFAGLEVLAVAICLHLTLRRLARRQVITVAADEVRLASGFRQPETVDTIPRSWIRVEYVCSDNPFDVGRLALRAHARRYPVGECLGRHEKRQLAGELSRLLRPV